MPAWTSRSRRSPDDLHVTERLKGGSGTEFGVPGETPKADRRPLTARELDREIALLEAAWATFDAVAKRAVGIELRKGPRGGGRDLDKMVGHVMEAEAAYANQVGARPRIDASMSVNDAMAKARARGLHGLRARVRDEPIEDPSGVKKRWEPRYFVRRSAWHVLDHAWEIEDRMVTG